MTKIPSITESLALRCESVSQKFGSTLAVDEVTIDFNRGEIHAILGENGAGKSTLAKILSGELRPTSGYVSNGERLFRNIFDARAAGIRLVHQNLSLVEALTVTENFILDSRRTGIFPDLVRIEKQIEKSAVDYGLRLRGSDVVARLSMSERQWLEIFRALFLGTEILILDEPTSLLSPVESERLFSKLTELSEEGKTIILITHKLDEVFKYSHRTSVLRNGQLLFTDFTSKLTRESVTGMLAGSVLNDKKQEHEIRYKKNLSKNPLIVLTNIEVKESGRRPLLKRLSLALYAGKIIGVAGVAGNGQTELAEVVAGIRGVSSGNVEIAQGLNLTRRYVPADRYETGSSPQLSLLEILSARLFDDRKFSGRFSVAWKRLREHAVKKVKDYNINLQSLDKTPLSISGGNLQKVILAREMEGPPHLLIAHNPSSGLDIATSAYIRGKIKFAADEGTAVLLISDDLDELVSLADEILVMFDNGVAGTLKKDEFSLEKLSRLMLGGGM